MNRHCERGEAIQPNDMVRGRAGLPRSRCSLAMTIGIITLGFFSTASAEDFGVGVVCPHPDTQITFYTENDQQDAAGTIAYDGSAGFTLTSDSVKSLKSAEAHELPTLCDNGATGIRIDSKRDGWLQAGHIFLPPNQEWDYADWQDYLRKVAVWKPYQDTALYQGSLDAPARDKPYPGATISTKSEIYPLKFTEDFALVVVDETGAYAKSCAGTPEPPKGKMGWVRLSGDDGRPLFVPAHFKPC